MVKQINQSFDNLLQNKYNFKTIMDSFTVNKMANFDSHIDNSFDVSIYLVPQCGLLTLITVRPCMEIYEHPLKCY